MQHHKKLPWIFAFFFLLLGLFGLGADLYNRYYRGIGTPFLGATILCFLASLFFIVKTHRTAFLLALVGIAFILAFLSLGGWRRSQEGPLVYFYQAGRFNADKGRLELSRPFGKYPPPTGAYLSCHFEIKGWRSYLDDQPILCSAFDSQLKMILSLNDRKNPTGIRREVQWNFFRVDRKSLLGEPLDRGALRIVYQVREGWFRKQYSSAEIYQVFEREINPGQSRVLETFLRQGDGTLKSFTESSLPNLTSADIYATYDAEGSLSALPSIVERNFMFPAKIDVSLIKQYRLPQWIYLGGSSEKKEN